MDLPGFLARATHEVIPLEWDGWPFVFGCVSGFTKRATFGLDVVKAVAGLFTGTASYAGVDLLGVGYGLVKDLIRHTKRPGQ